MIMKILTLSKFIPKHMLRKGTSSCWVHILWWSLIIILAQVSTSRVGAETGAGMVVLSDIQDHPIEDKKKAPGVTIQNTKENAKVLSPAKIDNHIKIAESHLEDQGDDEDENNRVVRKDKSVHLQDPQKHASDGWLLHFLLEQYTLSENNVDERVEILQNLENFSHKFENGRDLFRSTNALKEILLPALNSSHTEIRKGACGVFAVAAQNNPVVQNSALENGVVRVLIHLIQFDQFVRSKALYALSSLLRNFPEAQKKFILDGGSAALVKAAFLSETRKRALTLITDMLNERKFCMDEPLIASSGDSDAESTMLLAGVEDPCDEKKIFEQSLSLNGWCNVLQDTINNLVGFDDEDQILIIETVSTSLDVCFNTLSGFKQIFQNLFVKFEADNDYEGVTTTLLQILSKIEAGHLKKDEL